MNLLEWFLYGGAAQVVVEKPWGYFGEMASEVVIEGHRLRGWRWVPGLFDNSGCVTNVQARCCGGRPGVHCLREG